MRYHLTLLALFTLLVSLSGQIPGKKSNAPVEYDHGIVLHVGDTLHLGVGTNPNGNFKYIYSPGALMHVMYGVGDEDGKLANTYNNSWLIVDRFRIHTPKRSAAKTYIQLSPGNFDTNYTVDLNEAIAAGEVVAINSMDVSMYQSETKEQPKEEITSDGSNLADQLIKLKQLHDAGALTDDEYQAAKEKLIGG